jgi:hypothetical protein
MASISPASFLYDTFQRPVFSPYQPAPSLLTQLDYSGYFLLSQIHALDVRLNHLCTDWWSGIERDYRYKAQTMSCGEAGIRMEEMDEQEGKFYELHREFWQLEEDRAIMISSLEHVYGSEVGR